MQKYVFAVSVSVKLSLKRRNYEGLDANVSGQCPLLLGKLCFQAATIFTFAVQFLSVCWSFILHSPKKNHPRTVIYETLLQTNISDRIPLQLDRRKLPA